VYTLHAELEGNTYLDSFERLLRGWRSRGVELIDMAAYAATLDVAQLPRCEMWRERWMGAVACSPSRGLRFMGAVGNWGNRV